MGMLGSIVVVIMGIIASIMLFRELLQDDGEQDKDQAT